MSAPDRATLPRKRARRAMVLQGGGALGAYQAGAYAALAEAGEAPDRVAGISIGAINAALIAGNPPEARVDRLRAFWKRVSARTAGPWGIEALALSSWGLSSRPSAALAAIAGAPGFFKPRIPSVALAPPGPPTEASFYDTAPLRATLLELVDFDLVNRGPVRLSVGAVNVTTGNFAYFDSARTRIGPEHVMASGALPPGFPPIEIDGALYWDGGLVSNTPLSDLLDNQVGNEPLIIWQIDLFPARGAAPRSVWSIEARQKDIRFSSRTRMVTDLACERHELACALRRHADALPTELMAEPAVAALLARGDGPLTIVHLIYRAEALESGVKDYAFSRAAMRAHWAAGEADVRASLGHPRWRAHDPAMYAMTVFDLTDDVQPRERAS